MLKEKRPVAVLVVEDDEDIRTTMVDVLELDGYHTLCAANGQEALDILETGPKPCLIFLDMMMPVMNGREFLDLLLKDALLSPIPVIIVSAIANRINTEGAQGYLKKPVDIDSILETAQHYCHKS